MNPPIVFAGSACPNNNATNHISKYKRYTRKKLAAACCWREQDLVWRKYGSLCVLVRSTVRTCSDTERPRRSCCEIKLGRQPQSISGGQAHRGTWKLGCLGVFCTIMDDNTNPLMTAVHRQHIPAAPLQSDKNVHMHN